MTEGSNKLPYRLRHAVLLAGFGLSVLALLWRAVDLQVIDQSFLQGQADARHLRVVSIAAHRGRILDRHGEPLAASTPVDTVWSNPKELLPAPEYLSPLANVLGLDSGKLKQLLSSRSDREFIYLKRHVNPSVAEQVRALNAPGVYLQREYRRYYPDGEVAAHVVGFTDIDDLGQEGLELAFDEWLRGEPGAKRVIKDGKRNIIEDVERIRAPRPGQDLALSIDRRIQYLAYRELKAAVKAHNAKSGSVVVLDSDSGEVLAMVNQPSYNPNNRLNIQPAQMRNRAVTDVFEPGSTLKPFTVAAGLEDGKIRPQTRIETSPGLMRVGRDTVRDYRNYGELDIAGILSKSSNVGMTKIAMSLEPEAIWGMLSRSGFGQVTASSFPGEAAGWLASSQKMRPIEQATLSFGYGLSVTPLQLAHAYTVFAADGQLHPVTFLKAEKAPKAQKVLDKSVAVAVRQMLEAVVGPEGTAQLANVSGYRVAGKTGTVRKSIAGGYADDKYRAVFAGMAPASNPRLVIAVMIDEPRNEDYYGGKVAAPLFSNIMSGALRLMNIAPDGLDIEKQPVIRQASIGGAA